MNVSRHKFRHRRLFAVCVLLLIALPVYAKESDYLMVDTLHQQAHHLLQTSSPSGHLPLIERRANRPKPYNIAYLAAPLMGGSLLMVLNDRKVKAVRETFASDFHYRYDDYIQFAPFALQIGLKIGGLRTGHSSHIGQMVVADAIGAAVTSGIVLGIKYTAGILRPDGSSYNSFPSGHTATAFLGAQLLYHEYGNKYPILGSLGYAMAVATGVGRVLNNRHWFSDVMAGAAIGVFSAEIGYLLSDLIFGKKPRMSFVDDGWGQEGLSPHSISIRTHHAFGAWSLTSADGSQIDLSTAYRIGLSYNYCFASNWCIGGEVSVGQRAYFVSTPDGSGSTNGIMGSMAIGLEAGYRWKPYPFLHIEPKIMAEYTLSKSGSREINNLDYRIRQTPSISMGARLSLGWHINNHISIDTFAATMFAQRGYIIYQSASWRYKPDFDPEIGTAFVLNL